MNTTNFSVQFVNANEISAVEILSNNLKKGASVKVVSYKETKMNKGTKLNRNPFLGRVFERTTIGGWVVGTNYSNSCQNAAERSGSEETFEAKKSWHTYYNEFFETDKATGTKFYLQLQKSAMTGNKTEKVYYLDGVPATESEVKEFKEWLPKSEHQQSSSQVAAGIDADHERSYILVTLANIESIEQGGFTYNLSKVETPAAAYAK
jgi:hypothetical protein